MTNAEALFNIALCPRKPEGSFGWTATSTLTHLNYKFIGISIYIDIYMPKNLHKYILINLHIYIIHINLFKEKGQYLDKI